jgi:hypothetical protein
MFSQRFALAVVLTAHARERMMDTGAGHHWIDKHYPERQDNLLCVAAVVDDVLVVKTVMHRWELTP